MDRLINVQYPIDSTGKKPAFDGRKHVISPIELGRIRIGNLGIYVLDARDITIGSYSTMLLMEVNGVFYKVPLVDYDFLFEFLKTHSLQQVSFDVLPAEIGITNALSFEKNILSNMMNGSTVSEELVYDFNLYAPVSDDRARGFFTSMGCTIDIDDSETYSFKQGVHSPKIDRGVRTGAALGKSHYDFEVEFFPGETGVVYGYNQATGSFESFEVQMVPGIHRYHVTYAPTISDKFAVSQAANLEVTGATFPEYRDCHEDAIQRAFIDSYSGVLGQQFYCPNKNFLPLVEKSTGIRM